MLDKQAILEALSRILVDYREAEQIEATSFYDVSTAVGLLLEKIQNGYYDYDKE